MSTAGVCGLAEAVPGAQFGERGLMGGGAAGHEVDRADTALGTPAHALIVAVGLPEHPRPGARADIIRSDIIFFETAAGGAVLSVGSMSFIGALPIDDYGNPLALFLENVVRRFADPAPFPWPHPGTAAAGEGGSA